MMRTNECLMAEGEVYCRCAMREGGARDFRPGSGQAHINPCFSRTPPFPLVILE